LVEGVWQVPEGEDGQTVVLCVAHVDFRSFNELFFAKEATKRAALRRRMIIAILRDVSPEKLSS